MTARALIVCSALLALGGGCYVVPGPDPSPYPAQQPAASTAPEPDTAPAPEPADIAAGPETGATPAQPAQPPAIVETPPPPDPFEQVKLTPVLTWTIAGSTPTATWSPDRSKLAVYSDFPQTPGAKNDKKYVDIIDIKTRKVKKLGPITSTIDTPLWLDESTLIVECRRDRCGKGKDGLYIVKTTGGAPKQILAMDEHTSMIINATPQGRALLRRHEYPPPKSDGTRDQVNRWEEWDPRTKKLTVREDLPVTTWSPPEGTAIQQGHCSTVLGRVYTFIRDGKMSMATQANRIEQVHVIAEAPPLLADYMEEGSLPCFSPEGSYLVYYFRDEARKQNRGTLVKVEGLPAFK